MVAINYNDMSIPQLRALIVDRGLQIGTARTKEDLIGILLDNDIMVGNIHYNDLLIEDLRTLAKYRGLPFTPTYGRILLINLLQENDAILAGISPTPPHTPPQVAKPLITPGAPLPIRTRNQPIEFTPVPPHTPPQVAKPLITPGDPLPIRTRTQPTSPTSPVRIIVTPITPVQQTLVPVVPITPQTKIPSPPVQPRVPVAPITPQRAPVVPIQPTRTPVVPIQPTRTPVAPITPQRAPVVPVQPTRAPVVPVQPQRIPVQVQPQRIPVQVQPQRIPVQVQPQRIPVQVQPQRFPVQPPRINYDADIRDKLATATFDLYDFQWKRGMGSPSDWILRSAGEFVAVFNRYQRIEVGTQRYFGGESLFTIEYLMTRVELKFIAELATALGFRKLNATMDVYYNLLWYLNIAENPYAINLTDDEKNYISGLEVPALLNLLGNRYRGPHDKASLIFAILSGKSSPRPDIDDIPRYPTIATYNPATVWQLAYTMYGLIDTDNNIYSLYPPYVHVALQPPSVIERVIIAVNETNVDALMNQFGIVLPTMNIPQTQKDKVKYFINEIKHYDPVFKRAPTTIPPPVLTGYTKDRARTVLAPYTLKEIVEAYEPIGTWGKRKELIEVARQEARGGSQWSWRHKWCNNDDTLNVVMGEKHGDVDKDDPDDPTLSYGVQKNYRCYQASELAGFWSEDEEGHFHFRVPDWRPDQPEIGFPALVDPTTGALLIRDFPIESIRQLRTLLENPPPRYNVTELLAKVNEGLNAANNTTIILRRLKDEYESKSADQQYIIRFYLAWLFTYGMWMRFWKGPGFRWPTQWIEGGGRGERCEVGRRDEHVFIQQRMHTAIIENYEQYPDLKEWIESLPLIDYNFTTGEAQIATQGATNIKTILDKIQEGDFCLPHGSDLILKTSYYLIVSLLNFKTGNDFNNFIDQMLPPLLDLERQVVIRSLGEIKDRATLNNDIAVARRHYEYLEAAHKYDEAIVANKQLNYLLARREKINALDSRLNELGPLNAPKAPPKQPPFDPTTVERTGHTDPGLGWQIRFGEE